MTPLALMVFAQLVGVAPLTCRARVELHVEGAMRVAEAVQLLADLDCRVYVVPERVRRLELTLPSSLTAIDARSRPILVKALADAGVKLKRTNAVIVEGPGGAEAAPTPAPVSEAELERGIHCPTEGKCVIARTLLDRVLADTTSLVTTVRIVPAIGDGKPIGFKLFAIRPGSLWARLGFLNGDTVQTVNDIDITSPEKALEAYTQLRNATRFAVRIVRHGEALTLDYEIR